MLSHVGHTILGMNSVQLYMKIPGCRTPGKCHLSSRMDLVGQKQFFFREHRAIELENEFQPWAAFSRTWSQVFSKWTSQPGNNI